MTLLGILTDVRPLQPLNAYSPMEVTLLGIVTVVRLVQPWKVRVLIAVTPFGMLTDVRLVHLLNILNIDNQLLTC